MFRGVPLLIAKPCFEVPIVASIRRCHSEVKIPVPWGHIAGKWWNKNGNRPIIAVHGWQDNANSFDRLVPLMSPDVSVLAIDLPGHGYSSHFPRGLPYHRMSAVLALRRVVQHYGWKSVCLMGHSLGGQNCFLYTAIYPDEVDGLVTLDILAPVPFKATSFIKYGGKEIDNFLKRDSQTEESAPTYTYEQLVEMIANSPLAAVDKEAAKILLKRGCVKIEEGKYRLRRDQNVKGNATAGWSSQELISFCLGLKTNVLCIKAESSPYFSTKEFFDNCWSNIEKVARSANLAYMPGNHHLHLENPDIIAPLINKFFSMHYLK